ncbi:hypothetical protein [Photobacterium leiognathi]|uniref:hypothetical protein n=1 Tax=Photobacterium leiognathi TaxID=553611 RepID=UPI002980FB38|nr:hypothetical protein [Photobacterium leiognathi]
MRFILKHQELILIDIDVTDENDSNLDHLSLTYINHASNIIGKPTLTRHPLLLLVVSLFFLSSKERDYIEPCYHDFFYDGFNFDPDREMLCCDKFSISGVTKFHNTLLSFFKIIDIDYGVFDEFFEQDEIISIIVACLTTFLIYKNITINKDENSIDANQLIPYLTEELKNYMPDTESDYLSELLLRIFLCNAYN